MMIASDLKKKKYYGQGIIRNLARRGLKNQSLDEMDKVFIECELESFERYFSTVINNDKINSLDAICLLHSVLNILACVPLREESMEELKKALCREITEPIRNILITNSQDRRKKTADLLREIEKNETPLKLGELYITRNILPKLPAMICGKKRPGASTLKIIIRKMKAGQL